MQAYLGDATLKDRFLAEITAHEAADAFVQGFYGRGSNGNFKGCAIGCALHSLNHLTQRPDPVADVADHDRFPIELGIPIELAYLVDHVFEQLPLPKAKAWLRQFAAAVPVGADLSSVVPTLRQWMLLDPVVGLIVIAQTEDERAIVRRFAALVERDWWGNTVSLPEWTAIDAELDTIRAWAWARARAGARARVGAGAWAWAWARARAWAWARVIDDDYRRLAAKTCELLAAAPQAR
jgi:hypothetical protein